MLLALENLGALTRRWLAALGASVRFFLQIIQALITGPWYFRQWMRQIYCIGYQSLPVVGMTAIFTGAVLALQSYSGFTRFSAESAIPTVVVLSMTRELGPVLAALMVAGRVGAAMTAEIGTMRVTEQIDALRTLSTNPFAYLLLPRVVAVWITLPLLVAIADVIGVMGGYLVSVHYLDFHGPLYMHRTLQYMEWMDVISGLIKASVFGLWIGWIGCYRGYTSQRGAQGVGQATTEAVVQASIGILLSNYAMTQLFFS